jgi:hypothetical protein
MCHKSHGAHHKLYRSHKGSHKGSHQDVQGIPQRIDKGLETICGNLESSHNFNIISELNVILAIQCREYCLSINIAHKEERRADDEEPIILTPPPAPLDPLGVDAPPNSADCLKRANQEEALRRCNFSDPELINEHYPAYVGKGTFNCPLSWINAAATKRGKARIILDWHMLTPKQQKEKLDAIYDNQLGFPVCRMLIECWRSRAPARKGGLWPKIGTYLANSVGMRMSGSRY